MGGRESVDIMVGLMSRRGNTTGMSGDVCVQEGRRNGGLDRVTQDTWFLSPPACSVGLAFTLGW